MCIRDSFQGLSFQLADLAVAVENSRNLVYGAARLKDRGKPFRQAAAMAKLYSTETVSYTHLRAHETVLDLVCRLLLEKKKH